MPFIPAPNIVQVEVLGLKDGQVIENRIMVNAHAAPTLPILTAIETIVRNWCSNNYVTVLPDSVNITGFKLTDQSSINGIFLQTTAAMNGSLITPPLPNEVSYCLSLRTAARGRSARGRLYIMGIAEGSRLGQNRVSAAYRAAVAAVGDALVGALATAGYHWSIVSYRSGGVPRPGGPVYFLVTNTTTTDDVLDSQRRRRPGIGV